MKAIGIFCSLLAASLVFGAELDRSKVPAPGPAPTIQIPEYQSFELDNGLKVFVVENHKLPTISFSLLLDVDPVMEGDAVGYLGAAGDLLRRGTKKRTKDQIDAEIDFIGGTLSTSSVSVSGGSLTKHVDALLGIMSDVVLNADFTQEELDKYKKQTISALAGAKDDPEAIMGNVRGAMLYGKDHPYGEIQTEQTVENITLEQCRSYYSTYFRPNVAYMAIVGDTTPKQAKKLMEKYFGSWKKGEVPRHNYKAPTLPAERTIAVVNKDGAVQTNLSIANIVDLKLNTPDLIKARVANMLLGGYSGFRLYNNLREDKGFTYGAYSSLNEDRLVGSFRASAQVRNEVTADSVKEFLFEINRIRDEKATDEEMSRVKNFMTGLFARRLEDPATIANFALNTALYDLPKDFYANYLKEIAAVTAEDIQTVAKKYFQPDRAYIIAVGNAEELTRDLASFGKVETFDRYGDPYDPNAIVIPETVTAQALLDRYVEAIGGKEKVAALEDIKIIGDLSVQGMALTTTSMRKKPDRNYNDIKMGEMPVFKLVLAGDQGTITQQGNTSPLEGNFLADAKVNAYPVPEFHYGELGVAIELAGAEKIGDRIAYKLQAKYPSGTVVTTSFDSETGLKLKEITAAGGTSQTREISDYREVDGLKFPYKVIQKMGPQVMELTVKTIEVNTDLSDDLFKTE